jgi:hypothetical protein
MREKAISFCKQSKAASITAGFLLSIASCNTSMISANNFKQRILLKNTL